MTLGASYEDDAITALANSAATPPKAADQKFSIWRTITAAPRGIDEALVQVAATGADILGGLRYMRDATPEQRKQMDRQGAPIEAYSSAAGDELRKFGREFRPDPATAHAAEQVVYGFSRGAAKVVGGAVLGGPVGVAAAGIEEGVTQADELRLQGVDFNTRAQAGAVQGAGLALAALPVIGQTKLATAGLYAVGGPGGFVAQQALTREILQGAGYDQIGAQFDPFDPVGLAVSALLPAGFAAWGLRQQKLQRAAASLPDLPPRADAAPPADPAAPVPVPSRTTAVADAVRAYPTEAVDAARVVLLSERRAAANPGAADNIKAMDQHEAALVKAEEQIAAGERVSVADVAPEPRVPAIDTPEFKAWFADSKVVDDAGKPRVVYHGTSANIDELNPSVLGNNTGARSARMAFFFSSSPDVASGYARTAPSENKLKIEKLRQDWERTKDWAERARITDQIGAASKAEDADIKSYGEIGYMGGANVMPVHVAMKNPYIVDMRGLPSNPDVRFSDVIKKAKDAGYDGVIFKNSQDSATSRNSALSDIYAVFEPGQVKSATGNSGAFDPTTGSLTDSPYAAWHDQITAAVKEIQAAAEAARKANDAPTTPQAANPEAAAPARGAGDAPTAAAADAGRAADLQASGLTPDQAKAAREVAQAEVITLRKRAAILQSLRECLA